MGRVPTLAQSGRSRNAPEELERLRGATTQTQQAAHHEQGNDDDLRPRGQGRDSARAEQVRAQARHEPVRRPAERRLRPPEVPGKFGDVVPPDT